jgi:hypothetical protein
LGFFYWLCWFIDFPGKRERLFLIKPGNKVPSKPVDIEATQKRSYSESQILPAQSIASFALGHLCRRFNSPLRAMGSGSAPTGNTLRRCRLKRS